MADPGPLLDRWNYYCDDTQIKTIEQILQTYVEGDAPALCSACFLVADRYETAFAKAYGSTDLHEGKPTTLDLLHWIASLTKLSTAVATLIAVEKGLVTLDENVRDIVPELADLEVLEGFEDDGRPRFRKCTASISLRYVGKKTNAFTGSLDGCRYPLIFEPGKGWSYGSGMDWAGRTIKITRPDLEADKVELLWRDRDGTLAKKHFPFGPAPNCCGGVGLFSTPNDQLKLLASLLRNEESDPIHFKQVLSGAKRAHISQTWPEGAKGEFGLSSAINKENFPERRAANSAGWQSMPSIHAWLDRTSGLAGLFTTQVLPPGDATIIKTFCALEEVVYHSRSTKVELR
ncbi:beta-lactamase family protein [Xylariaceae sp. FL0255]|nr:beta-lactamase family protein [Xylariaceae sp. FL0255]